MNTIKAWAYDVAVRAAKTFAQTLAGMLGANAVDILHVDWKADLAVAAGAAVACVLQNVQTFPSRQDRPATPIEAVFSPGGVVTAGAPVIVGSDAPTPPPVV